MGDNIESTKIEKPKMAHRREILAENPAAVRDMELQIGRKAKEMETRKKVLELRRGRQLSTMKLKNKTVSLKNWKKQQGTNRLWKTPWL